MPRIRLTGLLIVLGLSATAAPQGIPDLGLLEVKAIYIAPMPDAIHIWLKREFKRWGVLDVARRQDEAEAILLFGSEIELQGLLTLTPAGLLLNEPELRRKLIRDDFGHWYDEAVFQLVGRRGGTVIWKTEMLVNPIEDEPDEIADEVHDRFKDDFKSFLKQARERLKTP